MSTITVANSVFHDHPSASFAGVVRINGGTTSVVNCTLAFNDQRWVTFKPVSLRVNDRVYHESIGVFWALSSSSAAAG